MKIKTPKNWRKGQTLFNFLEWLQTDKGYKMNQAPRMADPFHIPDDELDKLWAEYEKMFGTNHFHRPITGELVNPFNLSQPPTH